MNKKIFKIKINISFSHIVTTNIPTPDFLQIGYPCGRPTNGVKAPTEKLSDLLTPSAPGFWLAGEGLRSFSSAL